MFNLIEVKRSVPPADIKRKIEEALARSAQIDTSRIKVIVQADKVF